MRAKCSILELQGGLFKVARSKIGKRMALSCGFVVIVRFFCSLRFIVIHSFPDSPAGAGKSVIWYAISLPFPWSKSHVVDQLCHYQQHKEHSKRAIGLGRISLL